MARDSFEDGSTYVAVKSWTIHPLYDSFTEEYDYAVLKLSGWVQKPYVILNTDPEYPPFGTNVNVIGFGRQSNRGPSSSVLLETQVTHIPNSQCLDSYPTFLLNFDVMLCALGNGTDT